MRYLVSRNGQTYGPYSLEELHRYLASGHVLPTDLARPDSGADATPDAWTPVAQILGTQIPVAQILGTQPAGGVPPSGPPHPGYSPPYSAMPGAGPYPAFSAAPPPPNLSWFLVLILDIFTCSLFQLVWNIVLGAWFRRVYPSSKVLWLYIASAALLFLQGGMGQAMGLMAGTGHGLHTYYRHGSGAITYSLVAIGCWVVRLLARFTFRAELEQHYNTVEPIGLRVDPVLTFFFGGIYLQSVMNRINETRRLAAFGFMPPR